MTTRHSYKRSFRTIQGWFGSVDFDLFEEVDSFQKDVGISGNILEIGAAAGRSAILLGYFKREHEDFVVCDTFPGERGPGLPPSDRHTFERNYLRFHETLPTIRQGRSSETLPDLPDGRFRLIHIDGSHEYADVRADALHAKRLMTKDGIVIFDDFRWVTVAAALWTDVIDHRLKPFCFSDAKMYATFGDHHRLVERLRAWAKEQPRLVAKDRHIFDHDTIEVGPLPSTARETAARLLGWVSRTTNKLRR